MKEEEKALLSFTDKDGNNREIFEKDLTDSVRPLVEETQQDLKAEQELTPTFNEELLELATNPETIIPIVKIKGEQ